MDEVIVINIEVTGQRGEGEHLLGRLCQSVNFSCKFYINIIDINGNKIILVLLFTFSFQEEIPVNKKVPHGLNPGSGDGCDVFKSDFLLLLRLFIIPFNLGS